MSTGSFTCSEHPDSPGPTHEIIQALVDLDGIVPGPSHHDLNCLAHAEAYMARMGIEPKEERSRRS